MRTAILKNGQTIEITKNEKIGYYLITVDGRQECRFHSSSKEEAFKELEDEGFRYVKEPQLVDFRTIADYKKAMDDLAREIIDAAFND